MRLVDAYQQCETLTRSHYENFPVASRLLPRPQRQAVAVIYAFARQADDFADEGEHSIEERLALLDGYTEKLYAIEQGIVLEEPLFIALEDVISRFDLPFFLFHDLLSAFRQDVTKTRYADFTEVLDYCRRSANPVGRLLLHLHGAASEENLQRSDRICSALQLINFMQDIAQDLEENDRIYLPQDEMAQFGVSIEDLHRRSRNEAMLALIDHQLARIQTLMQQGAPLGRALPGRFGLEIRLIIAAGQRVLDKLSAHRGNPWQRPRLGKRDYLGIFLAALPRRGG